jgi:hypothetical protein
MDHNDLKAHSRLTHLDDFEITIGPITRLYRPLLTTAPSDYDADTTLTLATGRVENLRLLLDDDHILSNNMDAPARLILVETRQLAWSQARYSSGLYPSVPPRADLFGEDEIAQQVNQRLYRGTPTEL